MKSKDITNKISQKEFLEHILGVEICDVSKASAEIMLHRFCYGKEIDFPFSK